MFDCKKGQEIYSRLPAGEIMRLTWDEATDIAMALEQQPGETLDSTGLDLYGDGEAAAWNDAEGFTSSSWLVKGGTGAGSEGGEDLGPEVLSEEANDNWAHFDQQAQEGDSLSGGGGAGWAVVQQDDWMDYTQHASPAPVGHVPVPRRGQGGVDSGSKSREVLEECFKAQSHSESHSHSHSKGAVRSRVEDVLEPDQQVERTGSDDEAKSDACMGMEHRCCVCSMYVCMHACVCVTVCVCVCMHVCMCHVCCVFVCMHVCGILCEYYTLL